MWTSSRWGAHSLMPIDLPVRPLPHSRCSIRSIYTLSHRGDQWNRIIIVLQITLMKHWNTHTHVRKCIRVAYHDRWITWHRRGWPMDLRKHFNNDDRPLFYTIWSIVHRALHTQEIWVWQRDVCVCAICECAQRPYSNAIIEHLVVPLLNRAAYHVISIRAYCPWKRFWFLSRHTHHTDHTIQQIQNAHVSPLCLSYCFCMCVCVCWMLV